MPPLLARCFGVLVALLVATLAAPPAFGLAQRTFVASYGSDTNACSPAFPCRSIDIAIGQTKPFGEVIILDSAGYGNFTVGQAVSIIAPAGVYAGISVFFGVGVVVAGGPVTLENLTINGMGGTRGITVGSATLYVRNCTIANFSEYGIRVEGTGSIIVRDTVIRGTSGGSGVSLVAPVSATLDRVQIVGNSVGLVAGYGADVTVKRSIVSVNGTGLSFSGDDDFGGATTLASVEDSLISDNTGYGIVVQASAAASVASLQLIRSTLTRNVDGALAAATAPAVAVINASKNLISQNSQDGLVASGNGATVLANGNTFSRNGAHALNNIGGTFYTGKGADGLPNNAGEQAVPTAGTITPLAAF